MPKETADAIVDENATARIDALRSSLSVIALIALIALFCSLSIPIRQPAAAAREPAGEESGTPAVSSTAQLVP